MDRIDSAPDHRSEAITDTHSGSFGGYYGEQGPHNLPENISQQMVAQKATWVDISWVINLQGLGDLTGIRLTRSLAKSMELEAKLLGSKEYTKYLTALKNFVLLVSVGQEQVQNEPSEAIVSDRLKCPENDLLICPIYLAYVLLYGDKTKGGSHVKQKGPFHDKTITSTGCICH